MATKKDAPDISPAILAFYDRLVAAFSELERKGATVPYTSFNGNMFSYLAKDGQLALRLPKQAREDFLTKYNTHLVEAFGIVQKEYVAVPGKLLENTEELKPWFDLSVAYVKSLKPKPTRKPKKAEA